MYRRTLVLCSAAAIAVALASCGDGSRSVAPYFGGGGAVPRSTGTGGDDLLLDAGTGGPPPADAGGLCGNEVHAVTTSLPNVYFVFDISGSMGAPTGNGTRYSVVQSAAANMVYDLRYVIRVGAAAFPNPNSADNCAPGGQVYPVTFGDPLGFDVATHHLLPSGGTPTAATLTALKPLLSSLGGKTVVVLATDGGPNCNTDVTCDISECQENIEGCIPGETCCSQNVNCCAPGGSAGPGSCIDHQASVQAVAALWAAGVKVYVVGIPGSKPYAKVLSDMALAGGAPQFASPFYYAVDDLSMLGSVLGSIATSNISCDISIDTPPQDSNYTNVYFDQKVVPSDATNGWTWTGPSTITLHGKSCDELRSGAVTQVQVVSGCPTEVSK